MVAGPINVPKCRAGTQPGDQSITNGNNRWRYRISTIPYSRTCINRPVMRGLMCS